MSGLLKLLLVACIAGVLNNSTVSTGVCSGCSKFDSKAPKGLGFTEKENDGTITDGGSDDSKINAELYYFKRNLGMSYGKGASTNKEPGSIGFRQIVIVVAISVVIGVFYNHLKESKQGNTEEAPNEEEKNDDQENEKQEEWWVKPVQYIVAFVFCLVLYRIIKSSVSCESCNLVSLCS